MAKTEKPVTFYPEILKPFERNAFRKDFTGTHSRTKQSFKGECDINTIMARYQKTAVIEHFNQHQGRYGDFTTELDYQSCLNQVLEAQDMFMTLPSSVRKTFENDPGKFLAFASDPQNLEKMASMGLAKIPLPRADQASGEAPAPSPGPTGTEAA